MVLARFLLWAGSHGDGHRGGLGGVVYRRCASYVFLILLQLFFYFSPRYPIAKEFTIPGDISVEAFTTLLIFKNMFSFALTWGAYEWIVRNGIVKTFNILGSVQVVICLSCVPMCMSPFVYLFPSTISPPLPLSVCTILIRLNVTNDIDLLGKRNRSFFHRHDILKLTGLR